MMAMDQQQQQRMQMHPSMYGRMPHSGMMPSQPQGHPGMPGSMGVPSAAGGVPGGPGADPRQAMGQMGGGGYHMSQHPSMMNNSQNNSYPGGPGVVPGGPPGGPQVGPQGAQLPMTPMTPHHQPYPHSQQQQQPTQQQTQQQQKQQHHNVPAASSSAPTHPSGNTSVSGHIYFRSHPLPVRKFGTIFFRQITICSLMDLVS